MSRLLRFPYSLPASLQCLVQAADPAARAGQSGGGSVEWQHADEGSVFNWDLEGWALGGGANRLDFRSQGERQTATRAGRGAGALGVTPWPRAGAAWAGIRQDFKPGSPQTWAAWASRNTIPRISTRDHRLLGENSQTALRLEAEYEWALTQRLILQPIPNSNFYGATTSPAARAPVSRKRSRAAPEIPGDPEVAPMSGCLERHPRQHRRHGAGRGRRHHDARLVVGLHLEF